MDAISYLENIEEIKRLKYSYFQACDINNLNQIKKIFATGNLYIDFENFGCFTDLDSFLEQYKKQSIKRNQVECHYGKNPIFKKIDNSILGIWALDYYLFQTKKQLMTNITGSYEDLYIFENGHWVIKKSKFRRNSGIFSISVSNPRHKYVFFSLILLLNSDILIFKKFHFLFSSIQYSAQFSVLQLIFQYLHL